MYLFIFPIFSDLWICFFGNLCLDFGRATLRNYAWGAQMTNSRPDWNQFIPAVHHPKFASLSSSCHTLTIHPLVRFIRCLREREAFLKICYRGGAVFQAAFETTHHSFTHASGSQPTHHGEAILCCLPLQCIIFLVTEAITVLVNMVFCSNDTAAR